MICDFCSATPVVKTYELPDYILREDEVSPTETLVSKSEGAWVACADCAKLIEASDQPALSRRAAAIIWRRNPELRTTLTQNDVLAAVEPMHIQFFAWLEDQRRRDKTDG